MDSTAKFFDLGSGLGRPNIHAAAMQPHICQVCQNIYVCVCVCVCMYVYACVLTLINSFTTVRGNRIQSILVSPIHASFEGNYRAVSLFQGLSER